MRGGSAQGAGADVQPEHVHAVQIPPLRKVGRYGFFALCAFGISLEAYGVLRGVGLDRGIAHNAANIAGFAAFFVLRDMSKQWDFYRIFQTNAASAMSARSDETAETGSVRQDASAVPTADAQTPHLNPKD